MERTTKISRLKAVKSLSFSDYAHLGRCRVASWPAKSVIMEIGRSSLPVSRAIVVGLFFHDMLKSLDGLYDLGYEKGVLKIRSTFLELLRTYRSRFSNSLAIEPSAFDYWPEITAIVRSVIEVFELDLDVGRRPTREKSLKSKRLRMHGIIDEIYETSDSVVITEYKTTQDASRLAKERNIDQIHFYALLVREHYSKPIEAQLKGLLGASVEVPIEEDRLLLVSQRVERFFGTSRELGETSAIVDLCNVSAETCPNCAYRLSCPAVLEFANDSIGDENEIAVVDKISSRDAGIIAHVSAGTVPTGALVIDDSNIGISSIGTNCKLVMDGLTYDEGRLSPSVSSRFVELLRAP